jgi:hypothetical protein
MPSIRRSPHAVDDRRPGPAGPRKSSHEARRVIGADFAEMPDLSVSVQQAARFWNLPPEEARAALDDLVADGFLESSGARYRVLRHR